MGRSVTLVCDCGCGANSSSINHARQSGWFELSQQPTESEDGPKLDGKLYFTSLKCLSTWAHKAAAILPSLQKEARSLSPRGQISNENVPGLYV